MEFLNNLETAEEIEELYDSAGRATVSDHGDSFYHNMMALDDTAFKQRFRMTKRTFNSLCQKVRSI